MTEEEKSHDTPVLLDLARSNQHPGSLDIHLHTRHGWTGVEVQFTGYAQDVTHTAITIVSAAGGLAGAAAALNSFFQRHRHRTIAVKTKKREVTVEGFSVKDTERLLKEVLDEE